MENKQWVRLEPVNRGDRIEPFPRDDFIDQEDNFIRVIRHCKNPLVKYICIANEAMRWRYCAEAVMSRSEVNRWSRRVFGRKASAEYLFPNKRRKIHKANRQARKRRRKFAE